MSKFFDELMESVLEMDDKTALSFEEKQACYDKVRGSNHLASPHIEGFDTHRTDADKSLPSRESALGKHRKNKT